MTHVLVITRCHDGDVTNPKIETFADDINAAMWHHIAVPEGDGGFDALVGKIHSLIQQEIDATK